MSFRLKITTENDAFEQPDAEIVRILRNLADRIEGTAQQLGDHGQIHAGLADGDEVRFLILDDNGNTVGLARYIHERED